MALATPDLPGLPGHSAQALGHAAKRLLGSRRLLLALLVVVAALWVTRAVSMYRDPVEGGIFRWMGVDFGTYYIQASALAAGKPEAMYSLDALEPFRQALVAYTSDPATPLRPELTPYPPLFGWLLSPLAGLSPPLAFALWLALNAALALVLAWRVVSFFPASRRLVIALLVLVSLPVAYAIWLGNIHIFLAIAVGEAFLAFRSGLDIRAGAWLGALIVKPQYLILIGPVLVWKRRWRALAGLAGGIGLILGASAVVAGPSSLAAYVGSMLASVGVGSASAVTNVFPEQMINWRALVLALPGGLNPGIELLITLILSGLTVVAILPVWRGPWQPTGPRFVAQMSLLLLATMLVSYHSHGYGPSMLAVPLAAYLASDMPVVARARRMETAVRLAVGAAVFAPAIWLAIGRARSMNMLAVCLVATTVLLLGRVLLDVSLLDVPLLDVPLVDGLGSEVATDPVPVR